MIGKVEWFKRRKYSGWGLTPATWQGWVYILVIILPVIIISNIKSLGDWSVVFLVVWALIFAADLVHIMLNMKKDEREKIHEAIAERNSLWVIVAVLGTGIAYQAASAVIAHEVAKVDPVILIAIFAGLVTKIISNVYLDKRD